MRYISYAQCYEDIILFSALKEYVEKGTYVDIGASDPCIISVTKFFYDLGWRGMNIEPLDKEYRLLCMERPEDENVNLGVSDEKGELKLSIAGMGSSFKYTDISSKKSIKQVERFEDIYRKSCFYGQEIHFCKIDVEGFEKNVLKGINFKEFRPWIFVIESVLPGKNIPCYDEWEDILTENGYLFCLEHGANRYYIEGQKKFLRNGLTGFRKVFWDNNIVKAGYSHMQAVIRDKLDSAQRIAIFGTGAYMDNFFDIYGDRYRPFMIVDNAEEKQGKEISGLKVQSPDILKEYADKDLTVLICCERSDEIMQQLKEMDIEKYVEYCWV